MNLLINISLYLANKVQMCTAIKIVKHNQMLFSYVNVIRYKNAGLALIWPILIAVVKLAMPNNVHTEITKLARVNAGTPVDGHAMKKVFVYQYF